MLALPLAVLATGARADRADDEAWGLVQPSPYQAPEFYQGYSDDSAKAPNLWQPPASAPRNLPLIGDGIDTEVPGWQGDMGTDYNQGYDPTPYAQRGRTDPWGSDPGWQQPPSVDSPNSGPAPDYFQQFPAGTYRPAEARRDSLPDPQGFRFRPEGHGNDVTSPFGDGASNPGTGYSESPTTAYPSYRFRGDSGRQGSRWQSSPEDALYHFRPLSERDLGRLDEGTGFRPTSPSRGSGTAPPQSPGVPVPGGWPSVGPGYWGY